jgi:hypothetical protein
MVNKEPGHQPTILNFFGRTSHVAVQHGERAVQGERAVVVSGTVHGNVIINVPGQ